MTKCEYCGKRIWFWQYSLWGEDLFPCPYCNKKIPNPNYQEKYREQIRKELNKK